jgi:preprotein translocase subunit SecA
MLRIIDQRWRQHLREMDLLREGIHLRAMGQKDPATEWQREGFEMFGMMMTGIANDFVKYVMHVQVSSDSASQPEEPAIADMTETKREASAGTSAAQIADANAPKVVEANEQRSKTPIVKTGLEKVGRNDPCPCGSGKKYKNCWGKPGCGADV